MPLLDIQIEFLGVPRRRAGRNLLIVQAETVGDALREIERRCPDLSGLIVADRLAPLFLLSLNGIRFESRLDSALRAGDQLLLMSADAGG